MKLLLDTHVFLWFITGPWLYAISERAGMRWELENKKPYVSVASYEKLLKTGELTQDKWWSDTRPGGESQLGHYSLLVTHYASHSEEFNAKGR